MVQLFKSPTSFSP
ncbi:coiled-coil domain containing 37 (predicted), isoform CRA_d [Rattus norvegicus]|uniref:Coiled-coil domain containing 37 (Predicted), isoform CRA_d n=1 Tax=Rattus norvegicus TaxID=10116 RepID=A6IB83_RAT|nr:coiled-coil domain containing 37 (predicted), isoform CRA_d [Rattus norvegicus]